MPQLDATSFPSQLFWLLVSFALLYFVLARFLLPRVQSVMSLRARTIEGDIAGAEHLRSEAARAEEAYAHTLADARARSQAMFQAAQAEGASRAAERQANLEGVIDKKLAESQASIRSARQDVATKLTPVAAELSSLIVEMLLQYKPASDAVNAAVVGSQKAPRI